MRKIVGGFSAARGYLNAAKAPDLTGREIEPYELRHMQTTNGVICTTL